MSILNQPKVRLKSMQEEANRLRQQGISDDAIIDRLSQFNLDNESKELFNQLKSAGMASRGVDDFLKLQIQQDPIVDRKNLETEGTLGKVGSFLGVEPLGRFLGHQAARLSPEHRENLSAVEEVDPESARELRRGGVTGKQLAGSIAQTGLTAAAFPLGRALTGGKFLGRAVPELNTASRALGEAGLGAAFGVSGELQSEDANIGRGALLGGALGAALPIAGILTRKIGRFGFELLTDVLNKTTSTPQEALKEILSASNKAQRTAIKNAAASKTNSEQLIKSIQGATDTVRTNINKVYEEGRRAVGQLYPEGSAASRSAFQDIKNEFQKIAKERGIVFKDNKITSIPPRTEGASPAASTNIKKAWESILKAEQKGDFSVLALDDLMQDFNALSRFEKGISTQTTPVVNQMIGYSRNRVKPVFPELADLRKYFGDNMEIVTTLDDLLRTDRFDVKSINAAANKLTNLFNDNNSAYLNAVRQLDDIYAGLGTPTNFAKSAAGLAAQKEAPGILRTAIAVGGGAGLGAIGAGAVSPAFLFLLPLFSPRAVQSLLRNSTLSKPAINAIMNGLRSGMGQAGRRLGTSGLEANIPRTIGETQQFETRQLQDPRSLR